MFANIVNNHTPEKQMTALHNILNSCYETLVSSGYKVGISHIYL